MFKAAGRLSSISPSGSVFAEYTALAIKWKAVNLGQGFPTLPVAPFIKDAAIAAMSSPGPLHQYARSEGHRQLVNVLAAFYRERLGRPINPMTEIVTTVGATEAIYTALQAFIDPGDEVILIQPFYDSYPASITLAGGIPVAVSLRPSPDAKTSKGWILDMDELEKSVTKKTKMIIINNPNNPIGKVFTRSELEKLADFSSRHNLLVIADEVYETLVFEDSCSPMVKFASLPEMWRRTITIGSLGKMLGVTGWKIGWIICPSELARPFWLVHQFVPFSVCTPLQEAAAVAISHTMETGFIEETSSKYMQLRDILIKTLVECGLNPCKSDGGYFVVADASRLVGKTNGVELAKFLTEHAGVTSIPMSAFYQAKESHCVDKYLRFAFCKDEGTLKNAGARLKAYFKVQTD